MQSRGISIGLYWYLQVQGWESDMKEVVYSPVALPLGLSQN